MSLENDLNSLLGTFAPFAAEHVASPLPIAIMRAKAAPDISPTISELLKISPTLNSVRYAMYRLPLEEVESFSTKCPTEKKVTEQEFVKVMPVTDEEVNPMELLKLTKRLVLCTECGTLRLIN